MATAQRKPTTSEVLHVDLEEIAAMLGAYSEHAPQAAAIGIRQGQLEMKADVLRNRIRGQYLNRISGNLMRSVTASGPKTPDVQGDAESAKIVDWFGTHLIYGAVHELGSTARVQVKQHIRKLIPQAGSRARTARTKKALRAGKKRFTRVRAHTKQLNFPARYYLRDSLRAKSERTKRLAAQALLQVIILGRVPTPAEVRGAT